MEHHHFEWENMGNSSIDGLFSVVLTSPEGFPWLRGYDGHIPRDHYFPSWLRDEFRRHLDALPLAFAPGKVSVVLHLRRSDLQRDDTRATADSYYYRLAEET